MEPLTRALDHQTTIFVDVGNPGLRLEVGMLLPTRRKLLLDHQVGRGDSRRSITFTDRTVVDQVAAPLCVHQWGRRIERQHMVGQRR